MKRPLAYSERDSSKTLESGLVFASFLFSLRKRSLKPYEELIAKHFLFAKEHMHQKEFNFIE
jgi:hypothetical protein